MISRNARGQVIRVHSYSGQMRKHGGDHAQRQDEALRELDAVASARVASSGPGYKVRKAKGLST